MSLLATDAPAGDAAAQSSATSAAVETPTQATPAASAWTWADESGKFSPDWIDKLGDEFKGNGTLRTLPDIKTLAKAYLDTKAMVGKKLAPPSETSTPEEIAKWRELLGAPATPDEYGSLMPEGFDAARWDVGIEKEFAALAHKYHLPASAVKEIAQLQAKGAMMADEKQAVLAQERLEAGRGELRKEWGQNFDRHAAQVKALTAFLEIDPADPILSDRPDLLIKFAKAAPVLLGPDKIVTGVTPSISGGIEARKDAIMKSDDYQGKNGEAKQKAAQAALHGLMKAAAVSKT